MTEPLQAPFPYFGGKRRAAPMVWAELGDVGGYVEPFAGSAAVLLARPPFRGRRVETLNDADGWLVNAWRAIKLSPAAVAEHTYGPVSEVDYHARLAWLQERRGHELVAWLEGDPEHHDPKAAGWWLYVMSCGIGDPFDPGPWRVIDGRLVDTRELPDAPDGVGVHRQIPHLGNAGKGVHREMPRLSAAQGVHRALPHLGDAGKGVHREHGLRAVEAYLERLAARLAHVRITCGDWTRVLTPSVVRATAGNSHIGIFLDPPYETRPPLYAVGDGSISAAVREWCRHAAPDLRIVLAGYEDEHDELLAVGWRKEQGRAGGGAGYNTDPKAGRRERLWMSPACLGAEATLFDVAV